MSGLTVEAPRLQTKRPGFMTRVGWAFDAAARKVWLGGACILDLSVVARVMILLGIMTNDDRHSVFHEHFVAAFEPILPATLVAAAYGAAAALIGSMLYLRDTKLWISYIAGQLATLVALVIGTAVWMLMIVMITFGGSTELGFEAYWLFIIALACGLVAIIVSSKSAWREWAEKETVREIYYAPVVQAPLPPPPRDNVMY